MLRWAAAIFKLAARLARANRYAHEHTLRTGTKNDWQLSKKRLTKLVDVVVAQHGLSALLAWTEMAYPDTLDAVW